ncbi:MAG: hypothetical protein ACAI44_20455 [Candidatus Sericytochromatia bacterium]
MAKHTHQQGPDSPRKKFSTTSKVFLAGMALGLVALLAFVARTASFSLSGMQEQIGKAGQEMNQMLKDAKGDPEHYAKLKREGVLAVGRIQQVEDTRQTFNGNPRVRLHLDVKPKDKHFKPYKAVLTQIVSRVAIPRAGDLLGLKFNRNNPQDLIWLHPEDIPKGL